MLKQIFKGVDSKKSFTPEEINEFLSLMDVNKKGKVQQKDFEELVNRFFINTEKKGSHDYQKYNPDEFVHIDHKTQKLKKSLQDILKTHMSLSD